MLALERKATVTNSGNINVRAQPFGGGVRILDPNPLQELIGEIQFDSERSKEEQDLRILIPSSKWESVKRYCLLHLANEDDIEVESSPHRELIEEFEETINIHLEVDQYKFRPTGFVIEDHPVWTENWYARGQFTVRIYHVFEVHIVDLDLCKTMLNASQRYSDQELGRLAMKDFQDGGRGRGNSILTLPLDMVTESYLTLQPEMRYRKIIMENHTMDESVLAILENVDVPQYQRV